MPFDSTPPRRRVSAFRTAWAANQRFALLLALGFIVAGATYDVPVLGAWVGFTFAAYSAVANDSIQTIGTFIGSNRDKAWWLQWAYMGTIFLVTVGYSWVTFDGDVSYQRLATKGFSESPTSVSFLQVAAPLVLVLLTRLRMPVSTTFLLLSSFTTEASSVGKVLSKSLTGYVLAFGIAIAVWLAMARLMKRWEQTEAHPAWRMAQWTSSAFLWSVWLMQDAANIAVYLPRQLDFVEFVGFAGAMILGLGLLFRMGGEKVQEVVDEKSSIRDLRACTLIDVVYGAILYYFKIVSSVPMSTTWVFLGLLAGREVAMSLRLRDQPMRSTVKLIIRDVGYATVGLVVSMLLAVSVNEAFRREVLAAIGL